MNQTQQFLFKILENRFTHFFRYPDDMHNNRQKLKLIILLQSFVEVTNYNIYTTAPIK